MYENSIPCYKNVHSNHWRNIRKKVKIFQKYLIFNPISKGVSISLPPRGGYLISPLGNQGRSCFWPHVAIYKLKIFRNWAHMHKNLKNWARFQDFKILRNLYFASPWITEIAITRSIFEIESLSFRFSLIFMCSKNSRFAT